VVISSNNPFDVFIDSAIHIRNLDFIDVPCSISYKTDPLRKYDPSATVVK